MSNIEDVENHLQHANCTEMASLVAELLADAVYNSEGYAQFTKRMGQFTIVRDCAWPKNKTELIHLVWSELNASVTLVIHADDADKIREKMVEKGLPVITVHDRER